MLDQQCYLLQSVCSGSESFPGALQCACLSGMDFVLSSDTMGKLVAADTSAYILSLSDLMIFLTHRHTPNLQQRQTHLQKLVELLKLAVFCPQLCDHPYGISHNAGLVCLGRLPGVQRLCKLHEAGEGTQLLRGELANLSAIVAADCDIWEGKMLKHKRVSKLHSRRVKNRPTCRLIESASAALWLPEWLLRLSRTRPHQTSQASLSPPLQTFSASLNHFPPLKSPSTVMCSRQP